MIHVLDRVTERHPELTKKDVHLAWKNALASIPRLDSRSLEYLAVGADSKGRLIEMVGRLAPNGDWVIWHAFTPPTKKALKELRIL